VMAKLTLMTPLIAGCAEDLPGPYRPAQQKLDPRWTHHTMT
jgi:hypothetical protein